MQAVSYGRGVATICPGKHATKPGFLSPSRVTSLRLGSQAATQTSSPLVIEKPLPFVPDDPASMAYYAQLLTKAQAISQPAVTGRRVGIVAIGNSGRAYLGANIELKGAAPADTLHAEPFVLALARQHGETGIQRLIQSLQPCGPCRQIVREAGHGSLPVHILVPGQPMVTMTIDQLFPVGYSYATPEQNLFQSPAIAVSHAIKPIRPQYLTRQARQAAGASYLPNPSRKTWSGLAVKLENGRVYTGTALTISGPNPTITPFQDLMVRLVSEGQSLSAIRQAVLVEPAFADYSFAANTQALLALVSPKASFKVQKAG